LRLSGRRADVSGAVAGDREMLFAGTLGRLFGRRCLATPPPTTISRAPPLERTISVLPTGTGNAPASGAPASLFAADRMIGGLLV